MLFYPSIEEAMLKELSAFSNASSSLALLNCQVDALGKSMPIAGAMVAAVVNAPIPMHLHIHISASAG